MSKVKIRSIIILAFALIAAIVLGAVLAAPRSVGRADAATYSPTSVFSEGTGGDVVASEAEGEDPSFVQFSFNNDGNVYFRRDLALKWYTSAIEPPAEDSPAESTAFTPAGGALADAGKLQYFTMKFAFAPTTPEETITGTMYSCPRCGTAFEKTAGGCSVCGYRLTDVVFFDRYEISFDSAEENISKAAKSTNSIVFKAQDDGSIKVGIKNAAAHAAEEDKKDDEETDELAGIDFSANVVIAATNVAKDIAIALGEATDGAPGEFTVTLTVGDGTAQELGSFTNVGGNYLEYRSSASTTPSTPITFNAKLAAVPEVPATAPEGTAYKQVKQCVYMKELNGQTFELTDGRMTDNAPAVLVLNEALYGFTLGQRYSLSWEAIDVCDSSVSSNGEYYMLRTDKEEGGDVATNHIPTKETEGDDYKKLSTSTYFYPTYEGGAQEDQFVSIRYRLDDGRYNSNEADKYGYVYLSWYAAEGKVQTFADGTGENKLDMIVVQSNDLRGELIGPYYRGLKADKDAIPGPTNTAEGTTLADAAENYQTELNNVASNEKTSAGNGAYIYLPSFRGLITSNYADYRNLRFTISYKKENSSTSASTESSLRYNNLRFEIDTEGHYSFKVCASDAAGNAMKYYLDGELVDVTTSNIWDIDEIPTFEFDISYKGADVTEPGEQDPASRGTSFTFDDFEIVDLGSNIKEYTLYYFDTAKLPEGTETPGYAEFVENAKKYTEENYKDCLLEIKEYNGDITEDEDEWADTDNDYHWNPDSSLSFVPQKSGYYVLRLTYYDLYQPAGGIPEAQNYYEVVEVRNPYDYIPAKSDWLQNNVTSVVLFSISGALAIVIVVLFVVKPSDKKVEEVDLASLKGNKKKDKPNKK